LKEDIERTIPEPYISSELLGETIRPEGLELTACAVAIAGIKTGQRVLDIGCGNGATAVFIVQDYSCNVTGIDSSDSMVAFSRAKAAERNLSNQVQVLNANGERLPFENNSFDVVLSECAFSLMSDQEEAASEIWRVLKPEGWFILTDIILKGKAEQEFTNKTALPFCLAGSRSVEDYFHLFNQTGFNTYCVEDHSDKLKDFFFQLCLTFGDIYKLQKYIADEYNHRNPSSSSPGAINNFIKQSKPGYALIIMNKNTNKDM
jgi:ubiquinone/menaquinone biosynthesis C-methylase UbiE